MRRLRALPYPLFIPVIVFMLLFIVTTVHAHETRTVGPYQLTVGFSTEPAIEGQKNGVDLRVQEDVRVQEGEGDDGTPVEGLEETLQVEVTHVESGVSQIMPLRARWGEPGRYINDWIPTVPGQYRFRFFGTIEGREIDEVFESGPDTFGSVRPADELHFPEDVPAARELEGVVRGAQSDADEALTLAIEAEEQAKNVQSMVTTALGLAAVSLIIGVVALASLRR